MKKILIVIGTRPEAIKMAPVIKQLKKEKTFNVKVCATAQHRNLLDQVLNIFKIKSDYDFNIMHDGQTLSHITTTIINRMTELFRKCRFDLVLVHGDTTTSFATSLSAFYDKIPIGHVEAGLRSFDVLNPYPEEINRVFTDRLCNLYFAPTNGARENLLKEKVNKKQIIVTGNTVIDALFLALEKKLEFTDPALTNMFENGKITGKYILVTAHRRENFGKPFENICFALKEIAQNNPGLSIIYPVHPNPNVQGPVNRILCAQPRIHLFKPVDYFDFIKLMKNSYMIITDSGGIQEEAPSLKKPVLILRKVTERPEAIKAGTAKLAGTDKNTIIRLATELLKNKDAYNKMVNVKNPYGDGKASIRISRAINKYFGYAK